MHWARNEDAERFLSSLHCQGLFHVNSLPPREYNGSWAWCFLEPPHCGQLQHFDLSLESFLLWDLWALRGSAVGCTYVSSGSSMTRQVLEVSFHQMDFLCLMGTLRAGQSLALLLVPWLKDGSLFGCLGPQCHLGHPAVQALGQQSLEGGHSGLQDLSQLLWSMDQWCLMVWWWWFSLGFLVLHLTEVGTILQSSQALCCQLPMEPNWHCLGSTGRWNPHVMVVTSLPGGPDAVGSPLQKGLQTLSKQLFKMQEWQKQWG